MVTWPQPQRGRTYAWGWGVNCKALFPLFVQLRLIISSIISFSKLYSFLSVTAKVKTIGNGARSSTEWQKEILSAQTRGINKPDLVLQQFSLLRAQIKAILDTLEELEADRCPASYQKSSLPTHPGVTEPRDHLGNLHPIFSLVNSVYGHWSLATNSRSRLD